MLEKEKMIEVLRKCSEKRNGVGYVNECPSCPYFNSDEHTLISRDLLKDVISQLTKVDVEENRAFNIPGEHIDNVMRYYGSDKARLAVCREELGELLQALSKFELSIMGKSKISAGEARANIVEEVTHVAICLGMLQKIYNISQIEIEKEVRRKAKEGAFDISSYSFLIKHSGIYDIPFLIVGSNGKMKINPEWERDIEKKRVRSISDKFKEDGKNSKGSSDNFLKEGDICILFIDTSDGCSNIRIKVVKPKGSYFKAQQKVYICDCYIREQVGSIIDSIGFRSNNLEYRFSPWIDGSLGYICTSITEVGKDDAIG